MVLPSGYRFLGIGYIVFRPVTWFWASVTQFHRPVTRFWVPVTGFTPPVTVTDHKNVVTDGSVAPGTGIS